VATLLHQRQFHVCSIEQGLRVINAEELSVTEVTIVIVNAGHEKKRSMISMSHSVANPLTSTSFPEWTRLASFKSFAARLHTIIVQYH
jgi:hypothetical protein